MTILKTIFVTLLLGFSAPITTLAQDSSYQGATTIDGEVVFVPADAPVFMLPVDPLLKDPKQWKSLARQAVSDGAATYSWNQTQSRAGWFIFASRAKPTQSTVMFDTTTQTWTIYEDTSLWSLWKITPGSIKGVAFLAILFGVFLPLIYSPIAYQYKTGEPVALTLSHALFTTLVGPITLILMSLLGDNWWQSWWGKDAVLFLLGVLLVVAITILVIVHRIFYKNTAWRVDIVVVLTSVFVTWFFWITAHPSTTFGMMCSWLWLPGLSGLILWLTQKEQVLN